MKNTPQGRADAGSRPGQRAGSRALDTTASRMSPPALNKREQVVYSGSSTSSRVPPAARASGLLQRSVAPCAWPARSCPSRAAQDHQPLHCCASSSASRSCSADRPLVVIRSLRSMAAGVSTGLANRGSRGQGSVSQPVDQRPEINRNLAPVRGTGRQSVQNSLNCSITL